MDNMSCISLENILFLEIGRTNDPDTFRYKFHYSSNLMFEFLNTAIALFELVPSMFKNNGPVDQGKIATLAIG